MSQDLEKLRNQLLDAWELIKENDIIFHKYERLRAGVLMLRKLPVEDISKELDRLLAECRIFETSGEQALATSGEQEGGSTTPPAPEPTYVR